MKRDFTYISDIVNGIFSALNNEFTCEVFNLARGESRNLREYIAAIEINLGKKAILNYLPLQPGDIPETNADISKAAKFLDYHPKVSIEEGINNFVNWYKDYYS
jgi:UDP-glucuronate 4-epimerase